MRCNKSCLLMALGLLIVNAFASLASAQEWAKAWLENSPRHLEWVELDRGDRKVKCFVAYPEVAEKAHAVIVIHEIFGLTDWVRGVADQLAEAGYIAIAPDLLSGKGPNGGGTAELGSGDAVRGVIGSLPPDQITADLDAAAKYVTELPAANGTVSVAGFCWGGGQTFRYATNNPKLKVAFVFYGSGPTDEASIAKIACPVYGFYGENDARINSTIDATTKLMNAAGKTYEPKIYPAPVTVSSALAKTPRALKQIGRREEAWKRWKDLLANGE